MSEGHHLAAADAIEMPDELTAIVLKAIP